jgi:hypothetical protein
VSLFKNFSLPVRLQNDFAAFLKGHHGFVGITNILLIPVIDRRVIDPAPVVFIRAEGSNTPPFRAVKRY